MPGGPVCRAPRLAAPGPDRFTGELGSWSQRTRRQSHWLPEGYRRHSDPPGKTRRGHISGHCRFTAMGGAPMRTAGGGGVGWVQQPGMDLGLFTSLGHHFGLDHPFRLFLHLVLGGLLFGVYILRCFRLILIKACVGDRLVLDLRPALRRVSTYPVPESLSLPNSFIRELFL